jgi:hypothetical protein
MRTKAPTGHFKFLQTAASHSLAAASAGAAEEIVDGRPTKGSSSRIGRLIWPARFLFRSAQIRHSNRRFEDWRRKNPTQKFRDFYAEVVDPGLRRGEKHPTLGSNLPRKPFGESGLSELRRLVEYGLAADDVCVDYGCGTLRIGVHIIKFLNPGNYWGFDAEPILREGRHLIGDELITEKTPHLLAISPQSVLEAAVKEPRMVCSYGVVSHVHPDELSEYFCNILTIIRGGGRAIISGKWSEGATFQYSTKTWAHSLRLLSDMASEFGGELIVRTEGDFWLEDFGRTIKSGRLEVTKSSGNS